jgi:hypothetical protein
MFQIIYVSCKKFYFSPNIIRMVKSRRMRWAGHVARIVGEEECIEDFGGKSRRKDRKKQT